MTVISKEEFVCIAWDAAGVTTGIITVPIVVTLGLAFGGAVACSPMASPSTWRMRAPNEPAAKASTAVCASGESARERPAFADRGADVA